MHIFFGIIMDCKKLKNQLIELFNNNGLSDDISDIDWIMVEVLGISRSALAFAGEISKENYNKIMSAINQRLKHVPIAYIFGKTNFYGYDFKVNKNVLIPRMDTEILVEALIKDIKNQERQLSVLDIGTGSGAIIITIAKETNTECIAVDISKEALEVALQNANDLKANVKFIHSDLFKNVDFKVDFIVSNPPYIETDICNTLDKEVRLNEPILALDGGVDGLDFYKKIIAEAPNYLNNGGKLYFEIGYNQADAVKSLMEKDFKDIIVLKDYGKNDRVVFGTRRD